MENNKNQGNIFILLALLLLMGAGVSIGLTGCDEPAASSRQSYQNALKAEEDAFVQRAKYMSGKSSLTAEEEQRLRKLFRDMN